MDFYGVIELVGEIVDGAGVAAIVIGAVVSTVIAVGHLLQRRPITHG